MSQNKVLELFGYSPEMEALDWRRIVRSQVCPFVDTRCFKVRKSQPEVSIGTCSVRYGREEKNIIICPNRLLERRQVFTDCIQLLTQHEPGNEFHVLPEVSIPGGSVDYFLASVRAGRVRDFVAIEFQTLDSTGTVWPERQRLLAAKGIEVASEDVISPKKFGINWKMTAKTILVQLHHKVETLEHCGKHLVLVVQDYLLDYMRREFAFGHLETARLGDSTHLHGYELTKHVDGWRLELRERVSTNADGIARCLGLQADARLGLAEIIAELEKRVSSGTLLSLG